MFIGQFKTVSYMAYYNLRTLLIVELVVWIYAGLVSVKKAGFSILPIS